MSTDSILPILFRWAHVLAAVIAVGGLIFMRYVLMPSATAVLDEDHHAALQQRVISRWRKVVLVCIALLLVSGFYNFFTIAMSKAGGSKLYHPLFGIKFLAALGVFFLASVLTGRAPGFASMRAAARRWLAVAAAMGITVILISGILKNLGQ